MTGELTHPSLASEADHKACAALIRTGSRSFFKASLLLPVDVRRRAYALYAFCRLSDDAVDEGPRCPFEAVEQLRHRLDAIYAGNPADHPADRALADVVREVAMPIDLPEALLEGLLWDAEGRIYDTLSDVTEYGMRVAGAVGAMMTVLMGVRDRYTLARACDLGVAMQFTNICRDVGEDARNGRIYLPRDWLREAGVDPEAFLADPVYRPEIGWVVQRLLTEADQLYRHAEAGIAFLPSGSRKGIWAARLLYDEIGQELRRRRLNSVDQRTVVSKSRQLRLLGKAFAVSALPWPRFGGPELPESVFVLEAVERTPYPDRKRDVPVWDLRGHIINAIDIFDRLERRDHINRLDRQVMSLAEDVSHGD
ncbi:MAG: phytoene/squalene synthase family protein [Alphaproteobacteria bacterium]|nr:phytoene/squalene synthase family protein [Alphaproteobacteria bacterium]